jgi:hypothetical protein
MKSRGAAHAWRYPALVMRDCLFSKFRPRTGNGLPFSWNIVVTTQFKYEREGHPILFSHSPGVQSNQVRAPRRGMRYFQPARNARVSHGPAEGAGQAYLIGFVLAVTVVSVLAGARNYPEIARRSRDISQGTLMKLGSEWDWHERRYRRPGKTVIMSVLTGIDADELGGIVWKWLLGQSREDVGSEWGIALDGKVMRSAWTAENDRVIPFPAVTHRDSSTIAQVSVPAETNEITEAGTLLKSLGALGIPAEDKVLVTIDAARICRETARAIKRRKRLDYLMSVKGNRPRIHGRRSSLKSPPYPGLATSSSSVPEAGSGSGRAG